MTLADSQNQELLDEIASLQSRLKEAEETLLAIGSGEVDAFVLSGAGGEQVFTLEGADHSYRIMVECMQEGAAKLSADGTILYCNQRLSNMLNTPLESLTGMKLGSYVANADQSFYRSLLKNSGHQGVGGELYLQRVGLDLLPVQISCGADNLSNGETISVVITNLNERKRAERELEETRNILQAALDQSPAGIAIAYAPDGKLRYINDSGLNILGGTRETVVNDIGVDQYVATWKLLDFDGRPLKTEEVPLLRAVKFGETCSREIIIRRDDLKDRIVLANAAPIKTEAGEIGSAIAMFSDITELKQAGRELENQRKLLEKSQELGDIGSWDMDITSKAIAWTDETYKIFGIPIGTEVTYKDFFKVVHPEDREFVSQQWQAAVAGAAYDIEHRLIIQGVTKWVRQKADLEFDETGKAIRVVGFVQNITRMKLSEKERQSLENQLHHIQKIESIGRLAGGVAHDYNNMLSVIIGNAELAQMTMTSPHPHQENLEEILVAARRSRDITQKLLAFARKQTIEPKVLDLNTAVESILKMLEKLLGENIELTWQRGENIWPVEIDPSQLDQILANLCVNAKDAIADVGKLIIETDKVALGDDYCIDHLDFVPGDFVLLTVSDDGCGMDKEMLENIFEPFFTTKQPGDGTGLGLAMVHGAVKQSNGFIHAYSEPGIGSTFKIYLPRYQGEAVEEKAPVAETAPKSHGETIMVVEDEVAILKLVTTILNELGYEVLAALSPSEALTVAKEHLGKIELLVTDVVMPEMNGRDLADRLKLLYPAIKSLYMSGYTRNVIAYHGVLDKGIRFIQKPFSRSEFSTKIRDVLDAETTD